MSVSPWLVFGVALGAVAFVVGLWLDGRWYPVCPYCQSNARVTNRDGVPICADHGIVARGAHRG